MRRATIVIIAGLAVGNLAWEFIPVQVVIWDGSFDLTVRVKCPEGHPRSVSCEAFGYRDYADETVAHLLPPESRWSAVADPFDGQPITVPVAVSGRSSPFGRELRRYQFRYLVVIAEMPDGRRVGKVVDIPDIRVTREVSVTVT